MERITFIKNSAIYWIGKMSIRLISFFLLPVYTARIVPAGWGTLNILMIFGDVLTLVALCQMPSAFFRFWANTRSESEKQHLAGLVMFFPMVVCTVLFLPFYVFAEPFSSVLGVHGYGNLLRVILLTEQMAVILEIIQSEMRLRDEATTYTLFDIGYSLGAAVLNIFFVVVVRLDILGILLGQLIAFSITVAILLPRFLKRAQLNMDFSQLKKLLLFALPLIPSAVALAGVNNMDRFFIEHFRNTGEVGIYALGYRFGQLITILILQPFFLIWEPKSYELAQRPNASLLFGKAFTLFAALLCFALCGLTGAAQQIVQVMAHKNYFEAWKVIPVVSLAYVLYSFDFMTKIGLLIKGKTKIVMITVLIACGINIAGNFVLIPRWGMMGAAWSTLIAYASLPVMNYYFARNYLPFAWEWKKLGIVVVTGILVLVPMLLLNGANLLLAVSIKILLMAAFPPLLLLFGFFDPDQIRFAREVAGRIRQKTFFR